RRLPLGEDELERIGLGGRRRASTGGRRGLGGRGCTRELPEEMMAPPALEERGFHRGRGGDAPARRAPRTLHHHLGTFRRRHRITLLGCLPINSSRSIPQRECERGDLNPHEFYLTGS